MKAFLLVLLSSVLAINGLPSFEWEMERHSSSGVPLLSITFPSGEVDHAVLHAFNPIPQLESERKEDIDNCIFNGYLQNEPDVVVTLAGGCPHENSFEIMMNTQRLSGFTFKVTNGVVTELESPYKHMSRDGVESSDTMTPPIENGKQANPTSRAATALPSVGFNANVRLVYDQIFKAKFGEDSVNAIRRVMAFTQNIYNWPSLTTTVNFNIVSVVESSLTITGGASTANLKTVGALNTDSSINGNIFFTFENNAYGTLGIAWVGATCASPFYRSALVEYFKNDSISAQIVAHEIGHNLGMSHDFTSTGGARTSASGEACTNVGAIMDYNQAVYSRWSKCSIEDFLAYYNSMSSFCLPLVNAPSTLAPTTSGNLCMTTFLSGCGDVCKDYSYASNVICQGTNSDGSTVDCNCSLYGASG